MNEKPWTKEDQKQLDARLTTYLANSLFTIGLPEYYEIAGPEDVIWLSHN